MGWIMVVLGGYTGLVLGVSRDAWILRYSYHVVAGGPTIERPVKEGAPFPESSIATESERATGRPRGFRCVRGSGHGFQARG